MTLSSLDPTTLSPMMEQWYQCKQSAADSLLLFRMGDFYEAFYEDAQILARLLELTLTKRQSIPMSGIPHFTLDTHVERLVSRGIKVAIAEQIEDPKLAKGLVKRKVVRFVTPGTIINSTLLREKSNNHIVALNQVGPLFGLAVLDVTTGEFRTIEIESNNELLNELFRLQPSEITLTAKFREKHAALLEECARLFHPLLSLQEEWTFDHKTSYAFLTEHFQVQHLDGFGLKGRVTAINAAGALLAYLKDQLSFPINHIHTLRPYSISQSLLIDCNTLRHLEIMEPLSENGRSLLSILDRTLTPMGGRLLKHSLQNPLTNLCEITARQETITSLLREHGTRHRLKEKLEPIRDIERIVTKISSGYCSPRDLLALRLSLEPVATLKSFVTPLSSRLLIQAAAELVDLSALIQQLKSALSDEPPQRANEGGIIREKYHPRLDELRQLAKGGKEWIGEYQNELRQHTGIKTLKVGFNRVFGYYIEVSRGQAVHMPASFHRRQTLANCERFISPELKEYENRVLSAEEESHALEAQLFQDLRLACIEHEQEISRIARAIAEIDLFLCLAEVAEERSYSCPKVDSSSKLMIKEGRHPVVEAVLKGRTFIPNDTSLGIANEQLMLITGPNMAGKSTYIRQVALIVILAQMGSYVPAKEAHIGLCDKIFSRIGASDDLSQGQSTFMVEMSETANILNNATSSSLVILDEIGRGTSTFDGLSIAWAVAEYLLTTEGKKAKTLFATHYGELMQLEKTLEGACNYHVAVSENQNSILFLHKILRGGTERSYGIHVGRLAGLPAPVLLRAQQILDALERRKARREQAVKGQTKLSDSPQLSLFDT